jgi:hypothetical protein
VILETLVAHGFSLPSLIRKLRLCLSKLSSAIGRGREDHSG